MIVFRKILGAGKKAPENKPEGPDQRQLDRFKEGPEKQPAHVPVQDKLDRLIEAVETKYRAGDLEKALEEADELVKCSAKAETFCLRGMINFSLKKYGAAVMDIEAAVALAPGNSHYHFYAGNMKNIAGDFAGAALCWENVLRLDPGNFGAHYRVGLYYLSFGQHEKGFAHLDRAIELNPDLDAAYYALAMGLVNVRKDYAGALKNLDCALAISPHNPYYLLDRAQTRFVLGKNDGAMKDLELLEAVNPGFPGATNLRIVVKKALGMFAQDAGHC